MMMTVLGALGAIAAMLGGAIKLYQMFKKPRDPARDASQEQKDADARVLNPDDPAGRLRRGDF